MNLHKPVARLFRASPKDAKHNRFFSDRLFLHTMIDYPPWEGDDEVARFYLGGWVKPRGQHPSLTRKILVLYHQVVLATQSS